MFRFTSRALERSQFTLQITFTGAFWSVPCRYDREGYGVEQVRVYIDQHKREVRKWTSKSSPKHSHSPRDFLLEPYVEDGDHVESDFCEIVWFIYALNSPARLMQWSGLVVKGKHKRNSVSMTSMRFVCCNDQGSWSWPFSRWQLGYMMRWNNVNMGVKLVTCSWLSIPTVRSKIHTIWRERHSTEVIVVESNPIPPLVT